MVGAACRLSVRAQDEKVLEGAEEAKQRMDDERDALRARLAALRRKSALHVLLSHKRRERIPGIYCTKI